MSTAPFCADPPAAPVAPRIALVAGEASGDQLGAALIDALRERHPQAEFFGVGGSRMRKAGCETWWDRSELSVMGLFEVLRHLPRLSRLRRELRRRILAAKPDLFVGIDAPDFNLGLEKQLRRAGLPVAHYVSPTIWAWRAGRARTMDRAADMVLCLFPFEPALYEHLSIEARYTGHPLADMIPLDSDRDRARARLGMDPKRRCLALLPGSRRSEIELLGPALLDAAAELTSRHGDLTCVAALADTPGRELFETLLERHPGLHCQLFEGHATQVMTAANVVVCASGTASLEGLLVNRPLVVVYRFSAASYHLARGLRLIKSHHVAMPNILAGERLVPELLQEHVNGGEIALAVEEWLSDADRVEALTRRFDGIHRELRNDAANSAAAALDDLLLGSPVAQAAGAASESR